MTPFSTRIFQNQVITLDASSSYDRDGTIIGYNWSTGGEEATESVSFNMLGEHEVSVTVTDNDGNDALDTLTLQVVEEEAWNSNYEQVYFRGTPNNWDSSEMTLIDHHTWSIENVKFSGAATDRFKFDIYSDWSLNFGDNDGDGIADRTGRDIYINQGAGTYRITFNDLTIAYSCVRVSL